MASLTRSFLTDGPISGDPGDITAGRAYHVVWNQIGRAITDAANKNDENSRKVIDELKALRDHFKQEAEKSPNKRISELPPDVAREFLDVSRLIKNVAAGSGTLGGPTPTSPTSIHYRHRHHGTGIVNAAFEGRGPIGVVAAAGADALAPGLGIVVKAVQENSNVVRDTFHALLGSINLISNTFKAIHNFLNPNHPFGLINALSKLFGKKGGGGGGILSFLKNLFTSRVITGIFSMLGLRFLPLIRLVFRGFIGIGIVLIINDLIKKYTGVGIWELGGYLNKAIDFLTGQGNENKSGGSTHSFLNPGGGAVPGGQGESGSLNLNTRGMATPVSFNEGFNFNTGIAGDESDTIIQLMTKQTQLLAEILRALLTGRSGGQGSIRALQAGGTAAPGETVLVGEDGAESIQAGGRSGTVVGPHLLTAGRDPVQVNPAESRSASTTSVGPPSSDFFSSLPLERNPRSTFVSPIGNPNVRQDMMERQIRQSGEEGNYVSAPIRMNNPGAISNSTTMGGYKGDRRSKTETGTYTQYDTPEEGMRAQMLTLQTYQETGRNTIRSIIGGRPGHPEEAYADRGQPEYEAHLSKLTGRGIDEPWNFYDPQEYIRYGKASSAHEGGRGNVSPYTDEAFERAMYLRDDKGGSVYNPASPLPPKPHELSSKGVVVGQKTPEELASIKGGKPQQNATLPVTGGGPSTASSFRAVNTLKSKQRQTQGKETQQQPTSQQPQQQAPSRKQRPHKVAMTSVGMIALSSGSGFS